MCHHEERKLDIGCIGHDKHEFCGAFPDNGDIGEPTFGLNTMLFSPEMLSQPGSSGGCGHGKQKVKFFSMELCLQFVKSADGCELFDGCDQGKERVTGCLGELHYVPTATIGKNDTGKRDTERETQRRRPQKERDTQEREQERERKERDTQKKETQKRDNTGKRNTERKIQWRETQGERPQEERQRERDTERDTQKRERGRRDTRNLYEYLYLYLYMYWYFVFCKCCVSCIFLFVCKKWFICSYLLAVIDFCAIIVHGTLIVFWKSMCKMLARVCGAGSCMDFGHALKVDMIEIVKSCWLTQEKFWSCFFEGHQKNSSGVWPEKNSGKKV